MAPAPPEPAPGPAPGPAPEPALEPPPVAAPETSRATAAAVASPPATTRIDFPDAAPREVCGGAVRVSASPTFDRSARAYVAVTIRRHGEDDASWTLPPSGPVALAEDCTVTAAVPVELRADLWGARLTIVSDR